MSNYLELPVSRLKGAGASRGEIALLELEFERSDLSLQHGMLELFASQSENGIRAYIESCRDTGKFADVVEPDGEEEEIVEEKPKVIKLKAKKSDDELEDAEADTE